MPVGEHQYQKGKRSQRSGMGGGYGGQGGISGKDILELGTLRGGGFSGTCLAGGKSGIFCPRWGHPSKFKAGTKLEDKDQKCKGSVWGDGWVVHYPKVSPIKSRPHQRQDEKRKSREHSRSSA